MPNINESISRVGARLGNWNDRRARPDSRSERSPLYKILDRVAGWLYVR